MQNLTPDGQRILSIVSIDKIDSKIDLLLIYSIIMMTPSLQQMRYLVALRDQKSFSKAAEVCFVTQSTLSAGIKELESLLGQPVVTRRGRIITLTPFGLEMADEAEHILERAQNMAERAKQLSAPMSGVIRLGVIPTIAPYLLPDILPRLRKEYPKLELQLHENLSGHLVTKAEQGLLDLILLAFPFETPGMTQITLFDEPFFLACPTGQAPNTKYIKKKDLKPDELLLLEDGHCLRDHTIEACGLQNLRRRKEFSATSLTTLLQMVSSGYGMTLLPDMAASKKLVPKGVKIIPFAKPEPSRQIGLAWRKGSNRKEDFEEIGKIIAASP